MEILKSQPFDRDCRKTKTSLTDCIISKKSLAPFRRNYGIGEVGRSFSTISMEMLNYRRLSELHVLRTHLEFLEAYLTSDGKFAIADNY